MTRSTTYSDLKRKYSPLLQDIGSSISKVGSNQGERYVHILLMFVLLFFMSWCGCVWGIDVVLFVTGLIKR